MWKIFLVLIWIGADGEVKQQQEVELPSIEACMVAVKHLLETAPDPKDRYFEGCRLEPLGDPV